jgi:hypothetical protein
MASIGVHNPSQTGLENQKSARKSAWVDRIVKVGLVAVWRESALHGILALALMHMSFPRTHNNGPPLDDEHVPEWGPGGIKTYFYWKKAHKAAWKDISWDAMRFRLGKAEALGLTYEEYTSELLDRGRYLQASDVDRIARIKAMRKFAPRLRFSR